MDVIIRSFRGFLPKLRGNLIGMLPQEIASSPQNFIMMKVYPAPRKDERLVTVKD
jgi:hypothetical protein